MTLSDAKLQSMQDFQRLRIALERWLLAGLLLCLVVLLASCATPPTQPTAPLLPPLTEQERRAPVPFPLPPKPLPTTSKSS